VWVIGRVAYSVEYMADPANRGAGLMIQLVASAVLLFEALGRIVVSVVYGPFQKCYSAGVAAAVLAGDSDWGVGLG
jgi:hypothetical protein